MILRYSLTLLLLVTTSVSATANEPPRVLVSIAPLHSLVASIMKGVAEPELLIRGSTSPHSYRLRPSQMRALSQAKLIFWVSEEMEGFLRRPLAQISPHQKAIKITNLTKLLLLPARQGGIWEKNHATETPVTQHADHDHQHQGNIDNHVWLDPENAKIIAQATADALSEADPTRTALYQKNASTLIVQLENLHLEIKAATAAVINKPYLVFHDAYQYFEHRYQLNAVGSVTIDPDRKPGARRLQEIQQKLQSAEAHCIFSEPQFPGSHLKMLTNNGKYYAGKLDPVGINIPPGPDMYFILMRQLVSSFVGCLCQSYAENDNSQGQLKPDLCHIE